MNIKHTLHASVCFASCNRSDPDVLVAGKLRSRTEILANTGAYLEKKQLLKNNGTYAATFTVVILHKAGNIHYRCFSWNSQLSFIGSTSMCPLTTPTSLIITIFSLRCRQHSQNSQSKVHAKHYSITVSLESPHLRHFSVLCSSPMGSICAYEGVGNTRSSKIELQIKSSSTICSA